ncbi:hypothetical protein BJ138DRAFT_520180 [Hygrophoropsis aurantiaca]|uniref:Uncharacterized protein n=1 Tax=Hygrophoropsis aurantiaca TaxID=72124 RepID=A0ACB8A3P1_9AGAM|nr:hypothetical protein BJ138DRAFT_520180 [Hygrophoropsis aurantiaca]
MAAASYVAPPGYDYRRPIGGNYSSSYDTPVSSLRRRSPSPSSSSRRYAPYDSYVPRGGAPSRVEYENNYRPNTWRPGRYHSRSPSPDRFERTRPLEPHYGSHWRPPSRDEPRPPTSPVPPIAREKGRRDIMAERMFEPSDAWKQSQPERPMRRDFSEPFLDRYPEHRMRHVRDFSPLRSVARNEYPSLSAGDSYRPLANGRSYRDSYAFARSDTYRPCYDNEYRETWPHPVPPRSSGFHDRGDVRPLSTARSIASTPSHHANSPRGDIPNRNRYSYPGPVGYSAPSSSRERSLTPPTTRSRDSSLCEEPPRKKFKSYTSSRSSSVSGQNRLEPPPRSHLENPESHQSVQSPTPVYHTPFPVNAQSQIDSECSTPRDNLTPGDKSDAPDCPQKILCQPTSPLHPPLMYSVQAKAEPKAHDTISCLPTPPRDNPSQ